MSIFTFVCHFPKLKWFETSFARLKLATLLGVTSQTNSMFVKGLGTSKWAGVIGKGMQNCKTFFIECLYFSLQDIPGGTKCGQRSMCLGCDTKLYRKLACAGVTRWIYCNEVYMSVLYKWVLNHRFIFYTYHLRLYPNMDIEKKFSVCWRWFVCFCLLLFGVGFKLLSQRLQLSLALDDCSPGSRCTMFQRRKMRGKSMEKNDSNEGRSTKQQQSRKPMKSESKPMQNYRNEGKSVVRIMKEIQNQQKIYNNQGQTIGKWRKAPQNRKARRLSLETKYYSQIKSEPENDLTV